MLGGLAAAVAIIVFVTAHEAGHFFAAKAVGMKTTQFFFGFGPKIWSTQRGETEYGVKGIPLGGYVRIVGMNPSRRSSRQTSAGPIERRNSGRRASSCSPASR